MSSTIGKRLQKSRSSKLYCQEKFACQGERVEAEFGCEECATVQCGNCEAKLHEIAKFVYHDRKRLQPPQPESLCQLGCEDRNYADVRCENCALNFCYDCNSKMHNSGKRKLHKRISMKDVGLNQGFGDVRPLSPIDLQSPDDSNLFVSLPQDDFNNDNGLMSPNMIVDSGRCSLPDVAVNSAEIESAMESISLTDDYIDNKNSFTARSNSRFQSFMLLDDQEKLQVLQIF